jgi:hypothetical protein
MYYLAIVFAFVSVGATVAATSGCDVFQIFWNWGDNCRFCGRQTAQSFVRNDFHAQ